MDDKNIGANELIKVGLRLNDWEVVSCLSILLKRLKLYLNFDVMVTVFWGYPEQNSFIIEHNPEFPKCVSTI